MKCTYVAFMYRVTRGTRTCFSQGCQFQPLAQPAKEGPVQLIKQKDRGGGGGGGKGEKGVGKCGKRGWQLFHSASSPPPYHPDRKNNQESASSRNTSILYRRDYLWTVRGYFSRKFPRERGREIIWYRREYGNVVVHCENNRIIFLVT